MTKPDESKTFLNVLCLEDDLNDAKLIDEKLADAGFPVKMDISSEEYEYLSFLKNKSYNIILSDYTLPGFDIHTALKMAFELQPGVPFICVSGTISEDKAVELLEQGATDYILKDRPGRLAYAVRRALEGAEKQKQNKIATEELLKAKNRAEESEAIIRSALETSQAGIAIAECPSGKFKYINKSGLMIRGKEYDEIAKDIGIDEYVSSWKILHFDGTPFATDEVPLTRAILYGETNSREFIVRRDNNEDRYVWANAAPIYNESGIQTSAIVVFLDITDKKHTEFALKENEEQFRALHENAGFAVGYYKTDGTIISYNRLAAKNMNGVPEDFTGKSVYDIFPKQEAMFYHERIKKAVLSDKNDVYEDMLTLPVGNKYFLSTFTKICDVNNFLLGIQIISQDITERKQIESDLIKAKEKAEESDRLKSAFLANMSHEIRTPMNGIIGFAEMLKEPGLTGDEQQKYLSVIEKSGERMLNIINDIISISKIESGQMEIYISETNINDQIDFIYTFFKTAAEQKGLVLFVEKILSSKEAFIKTDREKVYSILTNLVRNALKFTHKGSIEIGYKKKENEIEFYVKDTGAGIQVERLEIIFERFRQGNESLSRNYEGAGLGLSISKAYVEMLGGRIWVESEEGKGSTFYFTIPSFVEMGEQKKNKNRELKETKDLKKYLKILIVEDDEISEELLIHHVNSFSKDILIARNGLEAVDICRNNPNIDLILMDIKMSVMDGYEATRQIRSFNKDVIIIAQTAFGLDDDRGKSITAGCNDYVSKPISKTLLIELIKKHLN